MAKYELHPITFYSNLANWLFNHSSSKMPAAQWLGTINALKNTPQDEVESLDLADILGSLVTITVDGISRPTLNSNGQPIYPTIEGIKNFWRWFDDASASRRSEAGLVSNVREGEVVRGVGGLDDNARGGTAILDRKGRPTVLYHGAGNNFDTFEHDHPNKNDYG